MTESATPAAPSIGAPRSRALRWQLVAFTIARTVVNSAHRMAYPFLPEFSRGLGVAPTQIAYVISARAFIGMISPLLGPLSDRRGRRAAMMAAMAVFVGAMTLAALRPSFLTFAIALMAVVVTKIVYDPAMQAYLGDRVPYSRRGLVIAVTELGWSGAVLIGIPLIGWLIAWTNDWSAPFAPLAILGGIAGLGIVRTIPDDSPRGSESPAGDRKSRPYRDGFRLIARHPSALAALSAGGLISAANENIAIVYGQWMETSFGLSVAALGAATAVIGVSELAAEALVGGVSDRLGKRRSIIGGALLSGLAYLALPFLGVRLALALGGLIVVYLAFEFTIVASIPLMTELAPEARATLMSANAAFHSAGRVLGSLMGVWLGGLGFVWNGAAAAALNLACVVLLIVWVKESET